MNNPKSNHHTSPGQVRLRDLKNGTYQLHSKKHGALEGDLHPVFWEAVNWGVSASELTHAIEELTKKGDDYAEFGMLGSFLFTAKNEAANV